MNRQKKRERKVHVRSENCAIVNVTVSFNVRDELERSLLDFADDRIPNMSGMVKRMLAELRRRNITTPEDLFTAVSVPVVTPAPVVPFTAASSAAVIEAEETEEFDPVAAFIG